MLRAHGPAHFRKLAIWGADWNAVAAGLGLKDRDLTDPRSPIERLAHKLLAVTQNRREALPVRGLERLLRVAGW
jgi:hypothetical protein